MTSIDSHSPCTCEMLQCSIFNYSLHYCFDVFYYLSSERKYSCAY